MDEQKKVDQSNFKLAINHPNYGKFAVWKTKTETK